MNIPPFLMTDKELLDECKNYDVIMEYYQAGQLSLSDKIVKMLQADIRVVYEEVKRRIEEKRDQMPEM